MRDNPYKDLPPLERRPDGSLYRMTPAQRKQAASLIRRECCCCEDGNGTQYFVCGNNRIKISEHFAAGGKPLGDLIVDVVRHTAEKAAST